MIRTWAIQWYLFHHIYGIDKKVDSKNNKDLTESLWVYHGDVYFNKLNKNKNIMLSLGKKTLLYDWLDRMKGGNQDSSMMQNEEEQIQNSLPTKGSQCKSYKQMLKGTLMYTVIGKNFENAVRRTIEKGIILGRWDLFNYSLLEVFFTREKKMNSAVTEQKFQNTLTVNAYQDQEKLNDIFLRWKKSKLQYQNELKDKLGTEKEAVTVMQSITKISLNKAMLRDLYHMWAEMMNRNSRIEKVEIFQIIMNFTNMESNVVHCQSSSHKHQITPGNDRIKKNLSFFSKHGDKCNWFI